LVRSKEYCFWASDEGVPYPEALWTQWRIPLAQLVIAQVGSSEDVWQVALEAVQTGLFRWVVIRPSRICGAGQLRKLQLGAEYHGVRVLLLTKHKLPHWVCQSTVEVDGYENSLFSKRPPFVSAGGGVPGADSQGQCLGPSRRAK